MRSRPVGGTIFALGLIAIGMAAAYCLVIAPIICGVTAKCGSAIW